MSKLNIDKETLIKMCETMSLEEMEYELGVCISVISKKLKEYGIKKERPNRLANINIDKLIDDYTSGCSIRTLELRYGVSKYSINKLLREKGF